MTKLQNVDVKNKCSTYPKEPKEKLLELRELIFTVASKNKSVGELEECLKWNEPSYLTSQSKSGSDVTPRLGPRQIIQSQFSSSLPHS